MLSAVELGSSTTLTMDSMAAFSANARLSPSRGANPIITFPLVEGMAFVTALYNRATPLLQSDVFFRSLLRVDTPGSSTFKWKITVEDNSNWLLYVTPANSGSGAPTFSLNSNSAISGPRDFSGTIQLAKLPAGADRLQSVFDSSAGVYPTSGSLAATTRDKTASYQLIWNKGGDTSRTPLMFALAHHLESFDARTAGLTTQIQLATTTKGNVTAVKADSWTMVENDLPIDMSFNPYIPGVGSITRLSDDAIKAINSVAPLELNLEMIDKGAAQSMYYSGKSLARVATMAWVLFKLANNPTAGATALQKLKDAFAIYIKNQQPHPLVYDQVWGGIVSTAGYTDSGADFGNTFYNDRK